MYTNINNTYQPYEAQSTNSYKMYISKKFSPTHFVAMTSLNDVQSNQTHSCIFCVMREELRSIKNNIKYDENAM